MNGKVALRITTHDKPVSITIDKELQSLIAHHPNLEWTGGKDFYQGPGAGRINAQLHKMLGDVKMTYGLLLSGLTCEVTATLVRDTYKDMTAGRYSFDQKGLSECMRNRGPVRVRMSVATLLDWHIANKLRCAESTRKLYRCLAGSITGFLNATHRGDLLAEHFDTAVMNQFLDYQRARGLADSSINEQMVLLRSAIKDGVARDYVGEDCLTSYAFRFVRNEHTASLLPEQLLWLETTDFTRPVVPLVDLPERVQYPGPFHGKTMQDTVSMFVLCCYTAFHYCDREELSSRHAHTVGKTHWIEKVRRKTKRFNAKAIVKLSPQARQIIAHYGGLDCLPKISYKTNYEYLYRLGLLMGLPFRLGTGNARNTFITLALNEWGFDKESVALMAGLKDIGTLDHYGRVDRRRVDLLIHWKGGESSPEKVAGEGEV